MTEARTDNRDGVEYRRILIELSKKAANAAIRNKPTMWAYYLRIRKRLEQELGQAGDGGGYAGAALAMVQLAEEKCPHLSPDKAADLWAISVYCRRIMRAWGLHPYGRHHRPSLKWLHNRARSILVGEVTS